MEPTYGGGGRAVDATEVHLRGFDAHGQAVTGRGSLALLRVPQATSEAGKKITKRLQCRNY